jgi:signal transduction histidine kinase
VSDICPQADDNGAGQGYGAYVSRLPRAEAFDRLLAAALVVLWQIEIWVGHATTGPRAAILAIAVVMPAAIAFRRGHPVIVGAIVLLANGILFAIGGHSVAVAGGVAWMCALYGLAVWTDRRGFLAGIGLLVLANAIAYLGPHHDIRSTGEFTWVPIVAMLIARRAVRDRQLLADAATARAELAVAEERARIARELHDLVAHNVSVMVVQAGAERHALPPEQASTRETLSSIEAAGRQALAEARRLLGMLRTGSETRELEPQPGMDQLGFLVEQIERAGLPVPARRG